MAAIARSAAMAAVYSLRTVSEVGIGNTMFYQTEPHYANKASGVGTLSLNCVCEYDNGNGLEHVIVKCIDVHPVLKCTTAIPASRVSPQMGEMKKFINNFIASQGLTRRGDGIAPLNDSRYIIDIALDRSPVAVAESWYKNERASSSSAEAATRIAITFRRVEDSDAVMRGCRAFLKKSTNGSVDPAVKFPPCEYPMWVRLHEATPDDVLYKKYRDSFMNWEVCDIFCTEHVWHYGSHLQIDDDKILHSAKACVDGVWCKVIYVEFKACRHCHAGYKVYRRPT